MKGKQLFESWHLEEISIAINSPNTPLTGCKVAHIVKLEIENQTRRVK
jgi:hypothetical protein